MFSSLFRHVGGQYPVGEMWKKDILFFCRLSVGAPHQLFIANHCDAHRACTVTTHNVNKGHQVNLS